MKQLSVLCAVLLVCLLSTSPLFSHALAADTADCLETVTYFADGSYLVTRITYDSADTSRAVNKKSGTKHHDYYNGSRQLLWTFRVHGTFKCDGIHAEATNADYSYDIYHSSWTFNSANAYYSGATASADGSFTRYTAPNPVTISLTCSPKGVLS